MPARVIAEAFVPVRVSSVSEPVRPAAGAKASATDWVIVPSARMLTVVPELTAVWMFAALTTEAAAPAVKFGKVPPVVAPALMVTLFGSISQRPATPAWTTPGSSRR